MTHSRTRLLALALALPFVGAVACGKKKVFDGGTPKPRPNKRWQEPKLYDDEAPQPKAAADAKPDAKAVPATRKPAAADDG